MKPITYLLLGSLIVALVMVALFCIAVMYLTWEARNEIELLSPYAGEIYGK